VHNFESPTQEMSAEVKKEIELEIAHVLLIDVVGYSKLLVDEEIEFLQELNQIVRSSQSFRAAETTGKLIRMPTGDGMALLFFHNPEEPVRCAVEISKALQDHPHIQVRMGIHSGPVNRVKDVNGKTNMAGAGINVAQRVLDCGDAGHILLSGHIAEDLAQYRHWQPHLHDLGECEVKHGLRLHLFNLHKDGLGNPQVPEKLKRRRRWKQRAAPVRPVTPPRWPKFGLTIALILSTGALAIVFFIFFHRAPPTTRAPAPGTTAANALAAIPEKSIAVLPFENLSDEKENAYFADGVQDEILTRLSKIADLKVISRTSTQHYKSAPENLADIAKQLGVAHILEGRVQKSGDVVRVNVQLIKAANDSHLWANTFDRKLTDIFSVESDIAKTIADTLQAKLTGSEEKQMSKKPTENPEAYELYLRGRFFWNKRTSADMKTALGYFEQAASVDPNYAVAYAGMADCYLLLPLYGGGVPAEMYPKAIAMAQKAISLDPTLGEPHASLGLVHSLFDFDFAASVREFEEAIRLNSNYAIAHHWFGDSTLPALGQFDRANAEAKRALELDPLSLVMITDAGAVYWITGRYQEAVAQFRKALEMDPRNYTAHWQLGQALECIGDLPGAIAEYEKSTQLDDDPLPLGLLAAAKAKAGDRPAALAILNRIQEIAKERYVPDYSFALIHLALGQKDEALQWLQSSYAKQQPDLNWIRVDPDLRPLHGDPRFEALAENIVPAREFNASATSK
jgi:TolB-like protein/class 3 adenylate cyclase/Tfp pilus assembly protein PilF